MTDIILCQLLDLILSIIYSCYIVTDCEYNKNKKLFFSHNISRHNIFNMDLDGYFLTKVVRCELLPAFCQELVVGSRVHFVVPSENSCADDVDVIIKSEKGRNKKIGCVEQPTARDLATILDLYETTERLALVPFISKVTSTFVDIEIDLCAISEVGKDKMIRFVKKKLYSLRSHVRNKDRYLINTQEPKSNSHEVTVRNYTFDGYFLTKKARVVGLEVHGTLFQDGEHVYLCEDKKHNRFSIEIPTLPKRKIVGYLHFEDASYLFSVFDKYPPNKYGANLFKTNATLLGTGNGKEVTVEIDFYDRSDKDKDMVKDIHYMLDEMPGLVKQTYLWD